MGQRERRWHVVAVADEPHTVAETGGLDMVGKLLPIGLTALGHRLQE